MAQELNSYNAEYVCINHVDQHFLQFEIIKNILVSFYRFIWIHMLWVYSHDKYFTLSVQGSNLDVIIWRQSRYPHWQG